MQQAMQQQQAAVQPGTATPLRILELIFNVLIMVLGVRFSPGRDDSSMPVTTVTGHVSLIDSRVPEGRQQLSRGSLSSLPGLRGHQRPYPSAIADGIEPTSLPGLNRIDHSCFTQYFQQTIPERRGASP